MTAKYQYFTILNVYKDCHYTHIMMIVLDTNPKHSDETNQDSIRSVTKSEGLYAEIRTDN